MLFTHNKIAGAEKPDGVVRLVFFNAPARIIKGGLRIKEYAFRLCLLEK